MSRIIVRSETFQTTLVRGLINKMNIASMVARRLLKFKKNDAGASCLKIHKASCQLQNIANFQMTIVNEFMCCFIVKMTIRHKKTCRNKSTLFSGTLMFRLK